MSKKVLIIIDGKKNGTIDRMATVIATGVREAGLEAICETVENANLDDLKSYDGIIFGSPCYFGNVSAKLKAFMDNSYVIRGSLDGKVGGAFTSSEHIGGGNELTLRAIQDFCLIHGMVIIGDPEGDHFGPIAVNPTGSQEDIMVDDSGECHRYGNRIGKLLLRLS